MIRAAAAIVLVLGVAATPAVDETPARQDPPSPAAAELESPALPSPAASARQAVDERMARMTLKDKVGQLLMIGVEGSRVDRTARRLLRDIKPGGVAVFRRNVENTRQVSNLLRRIRSSYRKGGVTPFLAVDQEGGLVVRLRRGALVLPGAMLLGAADDPELARRAGLAAGQDLKRLGFNVDLAPVLDVNSQAGNPVIGVRAFGDDPERVAVLGVAFAEGLKAGGVIPVAKHFPGHGDTPTDSHGTLPTLPHDLERLLGFELKPFAAAIREKACPAVMTAHVALPALEEEGQSVPATLSRRVVGGLLRERLNFSGVVLTDDLGMAALSGRSIGNAALKALDAGADLLLVSRGDAGMRAVQKTVLRAVRKGEIPEARIDESVRRILALKHEAGLLPAPAMGPFRDGPTAEAKKLVLEIARRGATLVKNRDGALPLPAEGRLLVYSQSPSFLSRLKRERPKIAGWSVAYRMSDKALSALVKDAVRGRKNDRVVVAAVNRTGAQLARDIAAALDTPVVLVSLGSPYLLADASDVEAAVAAYSFRWPACEAAAQLVAGEIEPQGKLPVTVPGVAERGTSLRFGGGGNSAKAARAEPAAEPAAAVP